MIISLNVLKAQVLQDNYFEVQEDKSNLIVSKDNVELGTFVKLPYTNEYLFVARELDEEESYEELLAEKEHIENNLVKEQERLNTIMEKISSGHLDNQELLAMQSSMNGAIQKVVFCKEKLKENEALMKELSSNDSHNHQEVLSRRIALSQFSHSFPFDFQFEFPFKVSGNESVDAEQTKESPFGGLNLKKIWDEINRHQEEPTDKKQPPFQEDIDDVLKKVYDSIFRK